MAVGKGRVELERFLLTSLAQVPLTFNILQIYGNTEGCRAHTVEKDTQYLNYHIRKNMTYTQNKQQF